MFLGISFRRSSTDSISPSNRRCDCVLWEIRFAGSSIVDFDWLASHLKEGNRRNNSALVRDSFLSLRKRRAIFEFLRVRCSPKGYGIASRSVAPQISDVNIVYEFNFSFNFYLEINETDRACADNWNATERQILRRVRWSKNSTGPGGDRIVGSVNVSVKCIFFFTGSVARLVLVHRVANCGLVRHRRREFPVISHFYVQPSAETSSQTSCDLVVRSVNERKVQIMCNSIQLKNHCSLLSHMYHMARTKYF